ncbi:MAG: VOC family protein [Candidatus Eiseniibacteriota bacterium]
MPEVTVHAPGAFCWMELATTDRKAAAKFYTDVLGWDFETHEMPEGMGTYTMVRHGGRELGGLYELNAEMHAQGVPPHWLSYINVESADESTNRAEAAGAEIMMGPMDVMDIGRMAVIQDPTGAVFAVWQAKKHHGAAVVNEPGTVCWHELVTRDLPAAKKFYAQTFGYELADQPMGPMSYTFLMAAGARQAGMMAVTPEMGPVPSHWMIYVAVDDCDARLARAKTGGAQVLVPPRDVPGVGRSATFLDPQGAAISIIQLT